MNRLGLHLSFIRISPALHCHANQICNIHAATQQFSPAFTNEEDAMKASTTSTSLVCAGLVMLAVFSAVPAPAATTWTVTSTADDPNDTTTLRGAINAAASGDTIDLTSVTGTIVLTNGQLFVAPNLTIKGPGASKLAISGNNSSRVFDIGADAIVMISGLTIKSGSADTGGGIRNTGTLTLTSSTISGNSATSGLRVGGGIYNFPGKTLTVTNSTLSGNSAFAGGGIFIDQYGGSVSVSNSTLSGNSATIGGGIYNWGGTLTVDNSVLSGNLAGTADILGSGAGIYNVNLYSHVASTTVSNSTLSGNSIASGPTGGSQGGSALTNWSEMTVTSSTLSGNSGNSGSMWNNGTLLVTNSTFSGNDLVILNQTVMNFTSSTLSGNGNGILNGVNGTVTLKNTILANNPARNCLNSGTITSQDHNISDDTTCAIYLIQPNDFAPHTDAGLDLAGLKDNGGPTETIALLPTSVAVNAINPSSDCSVSTDQRGVSRPQGTYCDIGAFELTPDFYFSAISAITANVGGSGSSNVQVNSAVGFNSAVTLSTSAVPSGLTPSFSQNSVTPPSYGSASSTLTVNIGPSVTPGSYAFNVVGTSGALTHSTAVNVTVQVTTTGTSTVIGVLQAAGCIDNSGISGALTSKLAAAQAYIAAGQIQDAINTLTALLNQLQAQAGKHIMTTCMVNGVTFNPVTVLINDVRALLLSLTSGGVGNPILGYVVDSTSAGISGATVNILNGATTVLTATTDSTGFYVFANTNVLTVGMNYTVKVTLPFKTYATSTPASLTFMWGGTAITLGNLVLN